MAKVIGVDLGSTAAMCALDTERKKAWVKTLDFSKLSREERIQRFAEALSEILNRWKPDAVFYEEVNFAQGMGAWVIHRQEGVLIALCNNTSFCGVNVRELKRWATGRGNAKKPEMVKAASEMSIDYSGIAISSDDEADAVLVALWGSQSLS